MKTRIYAAPAVKGLRRTNCICGILKYNKNKKKGKSSDMQTLCSFECDMRKYSVRPINKVSALRQTPCFWTCAVFSHIARKVNNV